MRAQLLLVLASLAAAACASAPVAPAPSPLALRQVQSRTYSETDAARVLKSVLATFQDEGFTVKNADAGLGFVAASREALHTANPGLKAVRWTAAFFTYGLALLVPAPKDRITQLEGTAHVEDLGQGDVRLRVSFQLRVVDSSGRIRELRDVTDPTFYQTFLARVDKSVFLQSEKL